MESRWTSTRRKQQTSAVREVSMHCMSSAVTSGRTCIDRSVRSRYGTRRLLLQVSLFIDGRVSLLNTNSSLCAVWTIMTNATSSKESSGLPERVRQANIKPDALHSRAIPSVSIGTNRAFRSPVSGIEGGRERPRSLSCAEEANGR